MTYLNKEKFDDKIDCPVCGAKVDFFDICDICGYQNSGDKEKMGDPIGPNKVTLKEAIENFNKYGVAVPGKKNEDY